MDGQITTPPDWVLDLIHVGAAGHGRSQQRHIGPSEVGTPCRRQLAYKLLEAPEVPGSGYNDPLPSSVGTGAHAEFEEFARRYNQHIGHPVLLPEFRVEVRPGLSGTCDLFHMPSGTVLDWKFPGTSSHTKYKRSGPSAVYRTQAHLYGRGMIRAGFEVNAVSIAFLPRGGELKGLAYWTEPYSDAVVDAALDRIDQTLVDLDIMGALDHPERIRDGWTEGGVNVAEPIDADYSACFLCPFQALPATDLDAAPWACPGKPREPDSISRLSVA
ncbi:hypothetical protein [Gordonia alkaliphila]|uniref:hypothetical protein n=1 Tax=Gordonia alkaliphila TaxID=1053547 RepID=UPI0031E99A87